MVETVARLRDRPDVEFFASLAAIARLSDQRLERAMPGALSLAGYHVGSRLVAWPTPPTPLELARSLRLSKSALTSALQRLERDGLIAVAADPEDGRKKRVALTAEGLAAQRLAAARLRPELEALRAAFAPSEFEGALPLLRRLVRWLDEGRERSDA